jgi:hypothetical protein
MGRSRKFDVGLDLKLLQNKVSIVDYFIDTRADLLIPFIPYLNQWNCRSWRLVLQQSMQELSEIQD